MIGVVVWSNKSREQAVIWCDDHAALAYLVGRAHFSSEAGWPEPGDMVELRDEVQGDLRYARAVAPLNDSPAVSLPQLLRGAQPARQNVQLTVINGDRPAAEPIPFTRRAAS